MTVTLKDRTATKAGSMVRKNFIAAQGDVDRSDCRKMVGVLKSQVRRVSNEERTEENGLIYTWQKLTATLHKFAMEEGAGLRG